LELAASVVIPTRNRRAALLPLLDRLLPEATAFRAEVVVVDNGSTDGTVDALRALAATANGHVRCVSEAIPGATRARNAGAAAARGDVIVYVDDDAVPRPGWLAHLVDVFADARVGAAGGCVHLRFDQPPPPWWDASLETYLAAYDLGPDAVDLAMRPWYESPRGLNMAIRRTALLEVGGFDVRLGPRAERPSVGEESDLCLRLLARGYGVRYAPGAIVDHLVDPRRLQPEWFFRRAFWTGWSEALIGLTHRPLRKVAGLVRWHYRFRALRLPYRARPAPSARAVRRECERQEALGYVLGLLRWAPMHRRLRKAPAA
jgi:glycosyltransferase involved in cell wall biosynthesis